MERARPRPAVGAGSEARELWKACPPIRFPSPIGGAKVTLGNPRTPVYRFSSANLHQRQCGPLEYGSRTGMRG